MIVLTIHPKDIRLNKANTSDTSVDFLELDLTIENWIISSKTYKLGPVLLLEIFTFGILASQLKK